MESDDFQIVEVIDDVIQQYRQAIFGFSRGAPAPAGVDITLTGANNFRFTVGVGLSLGILKIFADANFGSVTNYSAGIGFGR